MQFTFNNQTQGFGILTNLTSNPSNKYNTYCIYKNCFVDNPMIVFEENKILDFLKLRRAFEANSTFNESIEWQLVMGPLVLYFRVWNKRADGFYMQADLSE